MANDKGIDIPVTLNITGVTGDFDLNDFHPRKRQFPKRDNVSETRRDSEFLRTQASYFNMLKKYSRVVEIQESTKSRLKLEEVRHTNYIDELTASLGAKLELLGAKAKAKSDDYDHKKWMAQFKSLEDEKKRVAYMEVLEKRKNDRLEYAEKVHQDRLAYLREKESLRAKRENPLNKLTGGLPFEDLKHLWLAKTGKASILPTRMADIKSNLKGWAIGAAITAVTLIAKKTLTTIVSTSKKIVGFFVSAAKQAETFKNIMNLALAPIITMFTLLFVPLLIAIVPLIKTMFDWVLSNKDAIMAVGEKLGSVFNAENLAIVGKALDGILFVLDALANIFTNNASMIDTSSLDRFISSTVLAISNMIQDILLSIIAFCYSPEGQAFIKSISYSVGEIIGSIFTTIIALLPVIVESVFYSILGLINGIWSMISKAIYNLFDVIDKFTGGAISGFLNTIVNLINTAINALNSINIFGFSPFNIPTLNGGSVGRIGSSVNNFVDQSIVNNFNVNNAMRVSNPSVLKDVMSTGVY